MRVGFIGLGNIGQPIAEHIAEAGFSMVVTDIREDAAAPLVRRGAKWANSARAVAEQSDVVCTCLPGPKEMEEVALGRDGIAEGMRAGSVYVDHTTNAPTLVRKVHDVLANKSIGMLDAPVTGGMEGAQRKELTVLVGGAEGTLQECRPVLEAMSKSVMHVGDIGAGSVCKLMFNCAGFSAVQAIVECITLGIKAGVDPEKLVEMFQKSDTGSGYMNVRLPATLFQGNFEPPRFALGLAYKDIALATELATTYEVPMDLARTCAQRMSEAMSRGWGGMDSSIFLTLQEDRAGVKIRVGKQAQD